MIRYYQYCPIAQAAEILTERWTLLVLRELLAGSCRYNDLRRGVPLMSPSMFARRIKSLEQSGIIRRQRSADGAHWEYRPTEAAEELRELLELAGHWGRRWARNKLRRDDLDPGFLMWDIRRNIKTEAMPAGRTTIYFAYGDVPSRLRQWWLVIENREVDLCLDDPGYEIDLSVTADLRTMTEVWVGDMRLDQALASRRLKLAGSTRLARTMKDWFKLSSFAKVERPRLMP